VFKWGNLDTSWRVVYVLVCIFFLVGASDLSSRILDPNSACVDRHGAPADCDEDNAVPRDSAATTSPPPPTAEDDCVGPVYGEPRNCDEPGAVERSVYEDTHG